MYEYTARVTTLGDQIVQGKRGDARCMSKDRSEGKMKRGQEIQMKDKLIKIDEDKKRV